MYYTMEELIPLTAKLAEQYQSFESSSVRYETAQMLMEAVLYCVDECFQNNVSDMPVADTQLMAGQAYQRGYELVLDKAKDTKLAYEHLIQELNTYGCVNYQSTILEGIPSFFLYYDAKFQPQNHILTLDYPVIDRIEHLSGINRIQKYVSGLQKEKEVLNLFEPERIQCLLEEIMPDGGKYFMDNICETVLFRAVCCVIADREVGRLVIQEQDNRCIRSFLFEDSMEKAQQKVTGLLHMILSFASKSKEGSDNSYFAQLGKDFAVRMKHLSYESIL